MSFVIDCIKGVLIGSGAVLPGISSGAFLVVFGLYEKFLDSILNFFKYPKQNVIFLFPYIIGICIGVLLFSNVLNYFLATFPFITKSIFVWLILCGLPKLIKETNKKVSFKYYYLIFTLFSFVIGICSVILEKYIPTSISCNSFNFLYLVVCGFAMSIGVVIPGISSTVILMLLGVYYTYLHSVSIIYLPVLIPMGIGLVLGGFIFLKLTNFLLKNFYAQTFYSIVGFTLGSVFILMPFFS